MAFIVFSLLFRIAPLSLCEAQTTRLLEVQKIVNLTLHNSPLLKASQKAIEVATQQVSVERAHYNPVLQVDGIDSSGFPASSSMSDVDGIPGSPFREGWGIAIFGRQLVYDFGKTSALVHAANSELDIKQEEDRLNLARVQRLASQLYFSCALVATELEFWESIRAAVLQIEREVDRFVASGQRSVVERELVFAQTADLKTKIANAKNRLQFTKQRMALLAGVEPGNISCRVIDINEAEIDFTKPKSSITPPTLAIAQRQLDAAKSKLEVSRSQDNPFIDVTASYGQLQSARLVANNDYSVGVGLVVPLWDGDKSNRERGRDRVLVSQRESELESANQDYTDELLKIREIHDSATVRLAELKPARTSAEKAFRLAQKRYLSYAGGLADYRESIRNLERVAAQFADAQAQTMESQVLERILKGETL
jgi:outer membrane protein TolC